MKTFAISDVEDCLGPLNRMIEVAKPTPDDQHVFVRDYVTHGPDSKGVIDFLLDLEQSHRCTFFHGNHEEKFLTSRMDPNDPVRGPAPRGGDATLESYGSDDFSNIPENHWDFIHRTRLFYENETHTFIHANLEQDVPLSQQNPFTLVDEEFGNPLPHDSGKIMTCGHTAQKASHHLPDIDHAINISIETGVGRGDRQTCLQAGTGEYGQTNVLGEGRRDILPTAAR